MNKLLFHITLNADWQKTASNGAYTPIEYISEGYVFACYQEQLVAIANFLFRDHQKLLVLEIDPALLDCEVREVPSAGGQQLVPQIHGPIPVGAVVRTFWLEREGDRPFGDGESFGGAAASTDSDLPWYKRLFS